MEHNYVHNDDFNILTVGFEKDKILLSGETKEPLAPNDVINFAVGKEGHVLMVTKVTERRDSKDFPKGNGMFYRASCVRHMPEPKVVEDGKK